MTASDANLVGMYDQGLGVQPDVVEAHMWLTAVFCHRAGVGIRVRYRQPDGSPHHVFARRSRAGDRVTSPVPVPTVQDHLAVALCNASRGGVAFALPDRRPLAIIDYQMPLKARQGDLGVGKVDLFAVVDGRLPCVIELKAARETTRGDTPLRALLEGLAYCAIVEANAADIASEVAEQHALSASRPALVVMAPDNYWAGYLDHPAAGRWLHAVRDLVSGLRDTLGLEAYLLALLDARFEMGLSGQPARLIGRCRMVSVDEWLISWVRG